MVKLNRSSAFAEPTMMGFIGRFRVAWRTESFPVRANSDGTIVYFKSAFEAECAAWRVKDKIEQSTITGFCARADHARETAEQLFRPGKTPIPVDHKAGRKPFQVLTGRAGR